MTAVDVQTRTQLATRLYRAPASKADVDAAVAAAFEAADATLAWAEPLVSGTRVRTYGRHSDTRHLDDITVTALELWKRERPTESFPYTEDEAA